MKTHKNKIKQNKAYKIPRYTVCIDDESDARLREAAQAEDRKPAAMIAILTKRALSSWINPNLARLK